MQRRPTQRTPRRSLRSAALTVLSHLVATARVDAGWRPIADAAAAEIFGLIESEAGDDNARSALRGHAIKLLQLRGPALNEVDRAGARGLFHGLLRASPPYAELKGPWRFVMCSAWDFHEGECEVLVRTHGFKEIPPPEGAPRPPSAVYSFLEAPFTTSEGQPIQIFAPEGLPGQRELRRRERH